MNPKAQRIAIAQACGWSGIADLNPSDKAGNLIAGYAPRSSASVYDKTLIPHYLLPQSFELDRVSCTVHRIEGCYNRPFCSFLYW